MEPTAVSLQSIFESDARRVLEKAKLCCTGGLIDGEDCSWYHGGWPVLRALGLVSNPFWHFEFIRRHVEDRTLGRFLVLGTADASTPFLLQSLGVKLIDILDICPTPLYTCELVSDSLALKWRTVCGDALKVSELELQGQYDTIINDAFLTRFDQTGKEHVLSNVRSKLSPKGVYISTARIGAPSAGNDVLGYQSTDKRKDYFVERAVARFHEIGGFGDFSEDEIVSIAKGYMRKMVSHRFHSEDHLRHTLQTGGLKLLTGEIVTTPGESEESDYIRFLAVRSDI